jgi:hypothetical protein
MTKMDVDEIKRKLRELRRLEIRIRAKREKQAALLLTWDDFFDLREAGGGKAKYPVTLLAALSRADYKQIIDEYWTCVYDDLFREYELAINGNLDRDILARLDLPAGSDMRAVKKRFRELAKLYHPDAGGDAGRFIELMDLYRKLAGK